MDFELSDDQQLLRDNVGSFVRKHSPPARLRKLRDDALGYDRALYRQMGELGLLAILLPEEYGGTGGTFVDAYVALEQFGTTLVPEPYVPSAVLGASALLRAGTDAQRAKWLPRLGAGEATAALAYAERESRFDPTRVATRAEKTAGGYKLTGQKVFVVNGHAADVTLVSARTSGAEGDRAGVTLFALEKGAPGVGVQPVGLIDGTRGATLTLEGALVPADALVGAEGAGADVLEAVLDLGAAAACAEVSGLCRTVLDMTTEYLRTREQFGVKIGTFQALQHRAVDMFIECELARSVAMLAAIKCQDPDPAERMSAVSAAKAQAFVSGRMVTQQAIQLHGGIGITDEHDVGLYFKRMQALGVLYGDEEYHVARYASLPGFAPRRG